MSTRSCRSTHVAARGAKVRPAASDPVSLRALAAFAAVLLALLSLGTAAAQEVQRDQVTVPGSGAAYGEPDQAVLELGVEAADRDARSVIDATSEGMRRLLQALESQGIPDRDVRTVRFDLHREEPYDDRGEEATPVRYRLVHLVEVTVRDVNAVGDVLVAAVDAGADRIGSVRFGLAEPAALEERARRAAMDDARAKARQLADAAGRSLGAALRIDEAGDVQPPRPESARMMSLGGDAAPVTTGRLAVRVSVRVVYELE